MSGAGAVALAVLPIVLPGPHGDTSASSVFSDIAAAAELRTGLRLLSEEEMFVASADLGTRVRDCGSDIGCIANRLRTFDARLGLVVVVNLAVEPGLISLQLLDTDERRLIGESLGELRAGEQGGVSAAIRRRANELFERAGFIRAGRIVVSVSPPAARVSIEPAVDPDRGAASAFTVAPGRYEVRASLDGWSDATGVAVVTSGATSEVALALEEQPSFFASPWFWAIVGAAVAGGTATAIVLARPSTRCVCVTLNGAGSCDRCD